MNFEHCLACTDLKQRLDSVVGNLSNMLLLGNSIGVWNIGSLAERLEDVSPHTEKGRTGR